MRTQLQKQASLVNFTHHVNRFLSYGTVTFENRDQVQFFLKHIGVFDINVRVWSFEGFGIDIEPDYSRQCMTGRATEDESGWVVGLPALNRDDIEKVIGLDVFEFGEHRVVGGVVTDILVDDSGQEVKEED